MRAHAEAPQINVRIQQVGLQFVEKNRRARQNDVNHRDRKFGDQPILQSSGVQA